MALLQGILGSIVLAYLTVEMTLPCVFLTLGLILIRPFSQGAMISFACTVQGLWLYNMVFFMENVMNIQLRVTGAFPKPEGALVLSNHLTHDWAPMYSMAFRMGTLPYVRTVIKKSMSYIPGFGWAMQMCYWPFVSRDFKKDEKLLNKLFVAYRNADLPVQLWLYPEGTRRTTKKLKESQEYAAAKGYPVWDHLMLPRHRGFSTAINSLFGVVEMIHEITLSYEGWSSTNKAPSFWEILTSDRSRKHVMHVHLNRVPMKDVPRDEEGQRKWLMDSFGRKETLLAHFAKNAKFPGENLVKPYALMAILPTVVAWAVATYAFYRYFVFNN